MTGERFGLSTGFFNGIIAEPDPSPSPLAIDLFGLPRAGHADGGRPAGERAKESTHGFGGIHIQGIHHFSLRNWIRRAEQKEVGKDLRTLWKIFIELVPPLLRGTRQHWTSVTLATTAGRA